jgi:hypothetical protein
MDNWIKYKNNFIAYMCGGNINIMYEISNEYIKYMNGIIVNNNIEKDSNTLAFFTQGSRNGSKYRRKAREDRYVIIDVYNRITKYFVKLLSENYDNKTMDLIYENVEKLIVNKIK